MTLWKQLLRPSPTVEDLTPLLASGWTGGTVIAGVSGGVVTLTAENLTRAADATGSIDLLTLPTRLQPVRRLLGQRYTFRGKQVSMTLAGTITITDPRGIADHLDLTYVAKGGA